MGTLWRGCLPHFRQTKRINPLFWHPSCSIKGFHRRWPAQSASDIESGKSGQLTHIESWSWSKWTFPTLFCTTLALQSLRCLSSHYPAERSHIFVHFVARVWSPVKDCAERWGEMANRVQIYPAKGKWALAVLPLQRCEFRTCEVL